MQASKYEVCFGVVGVRCNVAPCLAMFRLTWLPYCVPLTDTDIIDTARDMCGCTVSAAPSTHRPIYVHAAVSAC